MTSAEPSPLTSATAVRRTPPKPGKGFRLSRGTGKPASKTFRIVPAAVRMTCSDGDSGDGGPITSCAGATGADEGRGLTTVTPLPGGPNSADRLDDVSSQNLLTFPGFSPRSPN